MNVKCVLPKKNCSFPTFLQSIHYEKKCGQSFVKKMHSSGGKIEWQDQCWAKRKYENIVLTKGKLNSIDNIRDVRTRKSLHHLAAQSGVPKALACRPTELLKLHINKITTIQQPFPLDWNARSVLHVLSRIGSQRISWARIHVLLWWRMVCFQWECKLP